MVEQADYDSKYLICKCGHEFMKHSLSDGGCAWNCQCKKFEAVTTNARESKK